MNIFDDKDIRIYSNTFDADIDDDDDNRSGFLFFKGQSHLSINNTYGQK